MVSAARPILYASRCPPGPAWNSTSQQEKEEQDWLVEGPVGLTALCVLQSYNLSLSLIALSVRLAWGPRSSNFPSPKATNSQRLGVH